MVLLATIARSDVDLENIHSHMMGGRGTEDEQWITILNKPQPTAMEGVNLSSVLLTDH